MTAAQRVLAVFGVAIVVAVSGCGWRGLNSIPLPGTQGNGSGAYTVQAQLPEVTNLEPNSRVRVGDVTVGNVTKIERQGWHALVTMRLNGDVQLPENATATVGQTSLLGSLHIELAPPVGVPPSGRLHNGSLITLDNGGSYPTTEQTLSAVSMLLNGGGIGQIQDITASLSTAFANREDTLRSLLTQLDIFIGRVDDQKDDIIAATDSVNGLARQFADKQPVFDRALQSIPNALAVLRDQREKLIDALDSFGRFSALSADAVNKTRDATVKELSDVGPVVKALADAGPSLTRSLSVLATYPWPRETMDKWLRGDYANMSAIIDLTLSRLDASFLTGTRFEGKLTELEMRWGRTIDQMPSPYTATNPIVVPYNTNQGP